MKSEERVGGRMDFPWWSERVRESQAVTVLCVPLGSGTALHEPMLRPPRPLPFS
jgi:hypothetical protein